MMACSSVAFSTFNNNTGSAVVLQDSTLTLSSDVAFMENLAECGSAIKSLGRSVVRIDK